MNISKLRGLKFPDEFITRFFFKTGLHQTTGRVLECGCSNGNNLSLFCQYGWEVTGLDVNAKSLADARHNFGLLEGCGSSRFIEHDLVKPVAQVLDGAFDCLSLSNIVCYLPREEYYRLLQELRPRLKPGCHVFLRTRTTRDYRYGRGRDAGRNAWILELTETDEKGCFQTLYDEDELVDQVVNGLGVKRDSLQLLKVEYQNPQNGRLISNADAVLWGTTK